MDDNMSDGELIDEISTLLESGKMSKTSRDRLLKILQDECKHEWVAGQHCKICRKGWIT